MLARWECPEVYLRVVRDSRFFFYYHFFLVDRSCAILCAMVHSGKYRYIVSFPHSEARGLEIEIGILFQGEEEPKELGLMSISD